MVDESSEHEWGPEARTRTKGGSDIEHEAKTKNMEDMLTLTNQDNYCIVKYYVMLCNNNT